MAMSTDGYVPTIQSVRDGYVWLSAEDNPVARELAGEDFDRFIASVRRDAWDEGFQDGRRYDGEGDDGPRYTNPYSGQDADQ